MAQGISKAVQAFGRLGGAAKRAATALGSVDRAADRASSGLSGVQAKANQAAAGATRVRAQATSAGSAVGTFGSRARSAGSGLVSLVRSATQTGKAFLGFQKDVTKAGTEATKSGKSLDGAAKNVTKLGPASQKASKGMKLLGAGFKSAMGPAGLILMLLQPFIEKLIESVMKSKTFQKMVSGAMKAVSKAIKWVKDAAKFVWDWIKKNWPLLLAIIIGPFGIAVYMIKKYWSNIKAGAVAAKNYVVGKFTALVSFFRGLPGKILHGLGNVGKTLFNKGKDLILGFVNGIKSMASHIVDAIKSTVTDKIPGFVKKMLGINSPSLVMMALGENVGEGMAVGIGNSKKHVDKSLGQLVDVPKPGAVRAQGSVLGAAVAGAGGAAARTKGAGAYEFHFHGAVKDPKETSRQFASRLRSWEILNAVR